MEMSQKEEQKGDCRELRITRVEFTYDRHPNAPDIQPNIEYIVAWVDGCEAHTSLLPNKKDSTLIWQETLSITLLSKHQRQLQLSFVGDGNRLLLLRTKFSFASQKKTIIIQEEQIKGILKLSTEVRKTEQKHIEVSLPSLVIPSELSMNLLNVQQGTIPESDLDLIEDLDVQSLQSGSKIDQSQSSNRKNSQSRKMSMNVETRRPSIWALQKAQQQILKIVQQAAKDRHSVDQVSKNVRGSSKAFIEEEEANRDETSSDDGSSGPIELYAEGSEKQFKEEEAAEQETARQTACQLTPSPIPSAKIIDWTTACINFDQSLTMMQMKAQNQWMQMEQLSDFVKIRTQSYHTFTERKPDHVRQRKIKLKPKTTQLKLRSRVVSEFSGCQAKCEVQFQRSTKCHTKEHLAEVGALLPSPVCESQLKKNFEFQKIQPWKSNQFEVFYNTMEATTEQLHPKDDSKSQLPAADDDSKDMAISVRLQLARMRNRVFKNLADEMTKSDKHREEREPTEHQPKPQGSPIKNHITGKREPGTLNSFISSNRPLINPDQFEKEEFGNTLVVRKFSNKKKFGATMQSAIQLYGSGAYSPNRHPFGDKIYENQSATTLQKSVLCYSMSKAERFGKGQQKTFESTYFTGSCFQYDKSKGTSFGFGTRKPYPSWLQRNMKEYPGPNSYQEDQAFSPKEAGKGYSFGLPYRYYQKAGIFQAQPTKKSPTVQKTLGRVKSKNNLLQFSLREQPIDSAPGNYHFRSRLSPVGMAPPR